MWILYQTSRERNFSIFVGLYIYIRRVFHHVISSYARQNNVISWFCRKNNKILWAPLKSRRALLNVDASNKQEVSQVVIRKSIIFCAHAGIARLQIQFDVISTYENFIFPSMSARTRTQLYPSVILVLCRRSGWIESEGLNRALPQAIRFSFRKREMAV